MDAAYIDETTGEITRVGKLERQLAEATTPAETRKTILEVDMLLKIAHAVGETTERVNELQITRIEAICQAGEMLAELDRGKSGRPSKNGGDLRHHLSDFQKAREEGQISERLASFWQKVATIPKAVRESYYDECIATGSEISLTGLLIFAKKPHVANNSGENEWYTPRAFIEAARATMGSIDLDPASSDIANKTVQAAEYFTLEDDGLKQDWYGSVWLNPPYAQPEISYFADKVVREVRNIRQICILVNNATETTWFQSLLGVANCVCMVRGRVKFLDTKLQPNGAPLQGQVVLYAGPNTAQFVENFKQFGVILNAYAE